MSEINKSVASKRKYCPKCRHIYEATEEVCPNDRTLLLPEPTATTNRLETPIGTVLADRYEILSEVGRGGMSIVYKARHVLMDKTRAIKMLLAQLMYDQTSKKRFQQEALAASCLEHPNIIAVHDFGMAPTGQPYLVMDFLVGASLADLIKRAPKIEQMRALKIFMQACDALSHAHKKGVIHRDLKSSNIMLVEDENSKDVVKVLDFGIAKLMPASGKLPQNLTQTGEVFGSPIYMSPEQCLGQTLDERSDIYSMGTMFYETLTGLPPLVGNTIVDTMQMHVATKPAPLESFGVKYYPELEAIVLKALEKKPENRFQTMEEMYLALAEVNTVLTGGSSKGIAAPSTVSINKEIVKHTSSKPANSSIALQQRPQPDKLSQKEKPQVKSLFLITIIVVLIVALLGFIVFHHW